MSFDDEDFIPESGALFNFGEIGGEELISKIWIKNDPVKEMSCGDDFVVLITKSGRVFSYGKNDWGQLGLGHSNIAMNPVSIKSLKNANEKAVHVACGRCHTLISTESNKLFAFGSNSEGQLGLDTSIRSMSDPTEIKTWNGGPIMKLSAGGEFSAALTENGDLYVWGSNSEGQLGMNDMDEDSLCQPTKLKFFPSPVTAISCGAYHMGAISVKILYMWGEICDGKLGLGDGIKANQTFPQKVQLDASIKDLSCGTNHSACLTSSGDVYIWGQGDSGQLGLGPSHVSVSKPAKLKVPAKIVNYLGDNGSLMEKFVKVSVGERHTAVINAIGLIFTFGDGRHGKLGNLGGSDSYSNHLWPTLIEKLNNSLWVDDVNCGGCHTVALIRHRHIDEQLDDVSSGYPSISTMSSGTESRTMETGSSRSRRHRKNNTNNSNTDDDSNLPTLKASFLSNSNENTKQRRGDDVEEEISGVKSSSLKSAPIQRSDSFKSESTVDDLERIQSELKKHVIVPEKKLEPRSNKGSLNENVDRFSGLMDSVYGDPVVNAEESTDEIVRARPRKKRKIKAVNAKQDPVTGFDQLVSNQNLYSDNEEKGTNHRTKIDESNDRDKRKQSEGAANPEVAKIGCQKSGACTML